MIWNEEKDNCEFYGEWKIVKDQRLSKVGNIHIFSSFLKETICSIHERTASSRTELASELASQSQDKSVIRSTEQNQQEKV